MSGSEQEDPNEDYVPNEELNEDANESPYEMEDFDSKPRRSSKAGSEKGSAKEIIIDGEDEEGEVATKKEKKKSEKSRKRKAASKEGDEEAEEGNEPPKKKRKVSNAAKGKEAQDVVEQYMKQFISPNQIRLSLLFFFCNQSKKKKIIFFSLYIVDFRSGTQSTTFTQLKEKKNTHKQTNSRANIAKSAVERENCQALVEKEILCCKKFGKNANVCIYWYDQDKIMEASKDGASNKETNTSEDAASLVTLQNTLNNLKAKFSTMQEEYTRLTQTPTDGDTESQLTKKKQEIARLTAVLKEKSEASNDKPRVSQEEIKQVKLNFYKFYKAWKERKQVCHQMIENIWSDKKIKDIIHNKLKGECDEDVGAKLDDFKQLFASTSLFYQQQNSGIIKKKKK
ncbi:hypothetical protein RFI_13131 [Reticulomyxa filosa]|uniref:Uncharacterized protein n=1 Tax=Reticulomyxa filosa TaxID=46433 RepID=X6NE60_RETFI|nr:hypothetical protein RFI_13131 [Reticulomyxa filosa]|eukprot:ETO24029.1 hypothetical protein RFI_13131 [Reticulomyxa filosa]